MDMPCQEDSPTCKGSYALLTACGACSRCAEERAALNASGEVHAETHAGIMSVMRYRHDRAAARAIARVRRWDNRDAQTALRHSRQVAWDVPSYCAEEVRRQGHDINTSDGVDRVAWMLNAWVWALRYGWDGFMAPTLDDLTALGSMIEPEKNVCGFRKHGVVIRNSGTDVCAPIGEPPENIVHCLETLLAQWPAFASAPDSVNHTVGPLELYRAFELIHPFADGNGRVGKILLNWRAGTLLNPFFPPNDFWGTPILNP